jgi:hypothetical protein
VPLAAAIGVLMRFAMKQHYASPLYAAVPTASAADAANSTLADKDAG